MNELEKTWLACAIDAEGCISIREHKKGRRSPVTIQITNTNLQFLKRANEIVPRGKIYKVRRRRKNEKKTYTFNICRHEFVIDTLQEILPYLIIKKKIAKSAIQFIKSYKWPFTYDKANPELVCYILEQAKDKGIRQIEKLVKQKFKLNICNCTVLRIIRNQGQWIRYCHICNKPFEVSQRYQRYCPEHTLSKYGKHIELYERVLADKPN